MSKEFRREKEIRRKFIDLNPLHLIISL